MTEHLARARDLAEEFRYQADWRLEKASEYPDDAKRNLECVEQFEKMAQALDAFEGGDFYALWCELVGEGSYLAQEALSEEKASIHFVAVEPERLFERIIDAARADVG